MDWSAHITTDPAILFGKPVIKGTRIPADLILERLGYGERIESLLEGYPKLRCEDMPHASSTPQTTRSTTAP